jgi:multidrug efflux pump subunit AcrB
MINASRTLGNGPKTHIRSASGCHPARAWDCGTVEDSAKAQASVFAVFPLMMLVMMTILMVQLQSFQRLFLVLATAPLALIGVARRC